MASFSGVGEFLLTTLDSTVSSHPFYQKHEIDLRPVIHTVDIFVFFHTPLFGNVCHTQLLSLVYKWCPRLTTKECGKHGGGVVVMLLA